eukprot:4908747-Pleurochrysis_carterae.AAC.1
MSALVALARTKVVQIVLVHVNDLLACSILPCRPLPRASLPRPLLGRPSSGRPLYRARRPTDSRASVFLTLAPPSLSVVTAPTVPTPSQHGCTPRPLFRLACCRLSRIG